MNIGPEFVGDSLSIWVQHSLVSPSVLPVGLLLASHDGVGDDQLPHLAVDAQADGGLGPTSRHGRPEGVEAAPRWQALALAVGGAGPAIWI